MISVEFHAFLTARTWGVANVSSLNFFVCLHFFIVYTLLVGVTDTVRFDRVRARTIMVQYISLADGFREKIWHESGPLPLSSRNPHTPPKTCKTFLVAPMMVCQIVGVEPHLLHSIVFFSKKKLFREWQAW